MVNEFNAWRGCKGKRVGEALKTASVKMIKQSSLTADCWLIQAFGVGQCEECECRGKRGKDGLFNGNKECGGKAIIARVRTGEFNKRGDYEKA